MVRKYVLNDNLKYSPRTEKKSSVDEPKVKPRFFGMTDRITFGKYKDYRVMDAIDDGTIGYSYMAWAINTIDWFKLDKDAFIYAKHAEKAFEDAGQSVTILKPYKWEE